MKKRLFPSSILTILLVLGLIFISCDTGTGSDNNTKTKTGVHYWTWVDNSVKSKLSVDYEELADGVVKVTVSGTPLSNYDRWKAILDYNNYELTLQKSKYYNYKVEMWTDSGTREISIQYYKDDASETWLHFENIPISTTRTEFEFTTDTPYITSKTAYMGFQCGDVTGVFYIKVISITENNNSKLNWNGIYSGASGRTVIISKNAQLSFKNMYWPGTELNGFGQFTIEIVGGGKMLHTSGEVGEWAYIKWDDINRGILVFVYDPTTSKSYYRIGLGRYPGDGALDVINGWENHPTDPITFVPAVNTSEMSASYGWAGSK